MKSIKTAEGLRSWLQDRAVHYLDIGQADLRVMSGKKGGRTETVEVPTEVFRALDGELVWSHDPEGGRLPQNTLFGLRDSLGAAA